MINAELLANRIPSAANDSVIAAVSTATVYPVHALLANDSDPDGDQLLLVNVTPSYATAQGGTVRLYGDTVRYAPPLGFTGNDTFDYTITDLSGVPVRALVSVAVVAPPILTITHNANGSVTVSWNKPADGWVLDEAISLASTPSATSWSAVAGPYNDNGATFSVTIPSPTGNKFYRLRR